MLPQGNTFKKLFINDVDFLLPLPSTTLPQAISRCSKAWLLRSLTSVTAKSLPVSGWEACLLLESQVLPQGNTQLQRAMHTSSALTYVEAYSPSPHLLIAGNIDALAGAPIQELVLRGCKKLTGTSTSCFYLKRKCCPKATILI